jgi:hypothetical protein
MHNAKQLTCPDKYKKLKKNTHFTFFGVKMGVAYITA